MATVTPTPPTAKRRSVLDRLHSLGGTLLALSLVALLAVGVGAAMVGLSNPDKVTCGGRTMTPGDTCVATSGDLSYDDKRQQIVNSRGNGQAVLAVAVPVAGASIGLGVVLLVVTSVLRRRRDPAAS
jgi:hypothetical protein